MPFCFFYLITLNVYKKRAIIIIFLDMTGAFDRVPHEWLLLKIKSCGLGDPLYSWLASYLSDRFQTVGINGTLSQPQPIATGLIRGSVLGPLLFLLDVNDIFRAIRHGVPYLFADDIKTVYSFEPLSLLQTMSSIMGDLCSPEEWCGQWPIKFSVSRSATLACTYHVPRGGSL